MEDNGVIRAAANGEFSTSTRKVFFTSLDGNYPTFNLLQESPF
jgi:hypothetical protein